MMVFKPGDVESPKSYMRIYEGDKLIREFVVCRNPEGKLGVYDRVGEKFYEFTNCVEFRFGDLTFVEPLEKGDNYEIQR